MHPSRPERPPRTARILLVDDEPDVLHAVQQTIEAFLPEVDVVTAKSGAEGLEALEAGRVDVIVSDYRMPGMNGLEFLSAARAAGHHGPRLLVTAYPDMHIAIEALNREHIRAFITKPFEPDRFIAALEENLAIERSRRHREQAYVEAKRRIGTR